MGGGSRVKQYQRRFFEGEQGREEKEEEAFHVVRTFGEYEIRGAESVDMSFLKEAKLLESFLKPRLKKTELPSS